MSRRLTCEQYILLRIEKNRQAVLRQQQADELRKKLETLTPDRDKQESVDRQTDN